MLAILHHPKVVFLDELSNGLDPAVKIRLKYFIKSYVKENNITLVIVSHDFREIEILADWIIILVQEQIIVNESETAILKKSKSISSFLNNI